MKIRSILSLATATLFIATSISVAATTSHMSTEKNMNKEEVQAEVKEMRILRTREEIIAEENVEMMSVLQRERLQDYDPDCDQDQTRDRDRLKDYNPDCDQDQTRDRERLQDYDPDCDQDQTRDRDRLQDNDPDCNQDQTRDKDILQTQTTVVAGLQIQTANSESEMLQNQQQVQTQQRVQECSDEAEQKQVSEMNQEQREETLQSQVHEQTQEMTNGDDSMKEQYRGQKNGG